MASTKNKQEPFFLNVWFNEPHFPMAAPEELKKRHAINPGVLWVYRKYGYSDW